VLRTRKYAVFVCSTGAIKRWAFNSSTSLSDAQNHRDDVDWTGLSRPYNSTWSSCADVSNSNFYIQGDTTERTSNSSSGFRLYAWIEDSPCGDNQNCRNTYWNYGGDSSAGGPVIVYQRYDVIQYIGYTTSSSGSNCAAAAFSEAPSVLEAQAACPAPYGSWQLTFIDGTEVASIGSDDGWDCNF